MATLGDDAMVLSNKQLTMCSDFGKEHIRESQNNLKRNPILYGAKIISQVNRSSWLNSRNYPLPVKQRFNLIDHTSRYV